MTETLKQSIQKGAQNGQNCRLKSHELRMTLCKNVLIMFHTESYASLFKEAQQVMRIMDESSWRSRAIRASFPANWFQCQTRLCFLKPISVSTAANTQPAEESKWL